MRFDSSRPIPMLLLGDSPDSRTGLGRIGHDLAWLVSSMPEFQVGYLGRQSLGRAKFPWVSYSFGVTEQWGESRIEEAWDDLAGDRRGIIFTIWDASRLLWFADGRETGLEGFLGSNRFERWGYFMADAAGVTAGTLPSAQAHVVSQYNRAVMASQWAQKLVEQIPGPPIDWIPHPINREVFGLVDRAPIRSAWGVEGKDVLIGCVMANQARKHWPVVMEAISAMPSNPRLWLRTDTMRGYWDLHALAIEYGIENRIIYEGRPLSDREMAMRYAACDATVVISGGEGFCYPVAESLSCGTPVVTGSYGAQAELSSWLIRPVTTVIETQHNVRRAVYRAGDVAQGLEEVLEERPTRQRCAEQVAHLNMKELGLCWKKWFRGGLWLP